jgi:hypothetical protein
MRIAIIAFLMTACYDPDYDGFAAAAVPTIVSGPAQLTNQVQPSITYRVDGPAASTECFVDDNGVPCANATNSDGSSNLILAPLADGPHHFTVVATDAVGTSAQAEWAWSLDATGPTVTAATNPSCWLSDTLHLFWSASDPSGLDSQATYTMTGVALDGTTTTASGTCVASPCDIPVNQLAGDVNFTIHLRIKDLLGNVGMADASYTNSDSCH